MENPGENQWTWSGWWLSPILWKMMQLVSWDDDIDIPIYEMENKKCLKPPTSDIFTWWMVYSTNLLFYCKVGLVLQILASSLCQNATLTVGG